MFHEPIKEFLYSAHKIHFEYSDGNKIISGTGTGFIIEISEGNPWIVTNRHVVDLNYKKSDTKYNQFKLSKFLITGRRSDDSEYTFKLSENPKVYFHNDYENDVALIRPIMRIENEKSDLIHRHFGIEHFACERDFEGIHTFALVCYSGFPNTHDKLSNRPILRSGHIAIDPKYNYSWDKNFQGQCVAYEGFSSNGASGSPMIAPARGLYNMPNYRQGFVIGINAGHIPDKFGHSGISYFYKSTVIIEIIKQNNLAEM